MLWAMFWMMLWTMLWVLPMADARAATAYVTDELVLGVYAAQDTQGQRLATLHSGATLETLAEKGDSTQVRLGDGTIGWVKTAYLTPDEPATVRIKQLQDELDRSRATTPELAEAAERNEVERLRGELAKQSELLAANPGGVAAAASGLRVGSGPAAHSWLFWSLAIIAAAGCGFWLGYATLARRIKYKFGGIKVY
jgi:hypothetical protein